MASDNTTVESERSQTSTTENWTSRSLRFLVGLHLESNGQDPERTEDKIGNFDRNRESCRTIEHVLTSEVIRRRR